MPRKPTSNRADGRYEIKRTITYADGKKKAKSFYGDSKRAAEQKYREFLMELSNYNSSQSDLYFAEVADRYLRTRSVNPTSAVAYERTVRRLKQSFQDRLIRCITTEEIIQYLNSMHDLSIHTVGRHLRMLRGIFGFALDNDLIDKNPALRAKIPTNCKEPKQTRSYTKEQARLLLNASKQQGIVGLSVFLPLKIGTRPGETAALHYTRDIDLVSKMIYINETVKIPTSGQRVGKPKTRTSLRYVPIDDETVAHLSSFSGISDYIFDNGKGDPVDYDTYLRHYFRPMMASMPPDFPRYRPHELRHTCGTLMYESGTDLYDVMKVMGHSDIRVTQMYVHQSREMLLQRIKREY